jgi:hypothetical protein
MEEFRLGWAQCPVCLQEQTGWPFNVPLLAFAVRMGSRLGRDAWL